MNLNSQVEREFVSWMEFYPHSKGQDPSPGSLRLPPSPQGRGPLSHLFSVASPLPRGEGGPLPALSPAGAGRVRGYLERLEAQSEAKQHGTKFHSRNIPERELGEVNFTGAQLPAFRRRGCRCPVWGRSLVLALPEALRSCISP